MTESPLPEVEITTDNFADFLPPEPAPLADLSAFQEAAEPTPADVPDDEIWASDAEEVDAEDTVADDAASWAAEDEDDQGNDPDESDSADATPVDTDR
jgi:hypothetical protein